MREQNMKTFLWIGISGLIAVFILIPEFIIAKLIFPDNLKSYQNCITIMLIVTDLIYAIIATIKLIQYYKFEREYHKNKVSTTSNELTSDFDTVVLKDPQGIPVEVFECQARIDEDGKIICKVHCDFISKFDNYEDFLQHFHFAEK